MHWLVVGLVFLALDPHFSAVSDASRVAASADDPRKDEHGEIYSEDKIHKGQEVTSTLATILLIVLFLYSAFFIPSHLSHELVMSIGSKHKTLSSLIMVLLENAIPYLTMISLKSIMERLGAMTSESGYMSWVITSSAFIRLCFDYYTNKSSLLRTEFRATMVKFTLVFIIDLGLSTSIYNLIERSLHTSRGYVRWDMRLLITVLVVIIKIIGYTHWLEIYWVFVSDSERESNSSSLYVVMFVFALISISIYLGGGQYIATPRLKPNISVSLLVLRAMDSAMNIVDGVATVLFMMLTYTMTLEICMASDTPMEYRFTIQHRNSSEALKSVAPLMDSAQLVVEARKLSVRKAQKDTRLKTKSGNFYIDYPEQVVDKLCPNRPTDMTAPCHIQYKLVPTNPREASRAVEMRKLIAYFLEILRIHLASASDDIRKHTDRSDESEWITEDTRWVNDAREFTALFPESLKGSISADALSYRTDSSFGDSSFLLPMFMRPKAVSCRDRSIGYSVLAALVVVTKVSAAYSWW